MTSGRLPPSRSREAFGSWSVARRALSAQAKRMKDGLLAKSLFVKMVLGPVLPRLQHG